jgi:predicted GNAT family N-acyltransferase
MNHAKTIAYPALNAAVAERQSDRHAEVRIARGFDDLLMVYAVRSAVYIAEQECPFAEEFDGNDHCATHLIGFIKGEPAGCIRVRFFHDFVKFERLAVLKKFRKSSLAFELCRSAVDLARRKGFRRLYAHSREGLEGFYARFGATPMGSDRTLCFSGFNYTEMLLGSLFPMQSRSIAGDTSSCARKATGTGPASLRFRRPGRSAIRGKMLCGPPAS